MGLTGSKGAQQRAVRVPIACHSFLMPWGPLTCLSQHVVQILDCQAVNVHSAPHELRKGEGRIRWWNLCAQDKVYRTPLASEYGNWADMLRRVK